MYLLIFVVIFLVVTYKIFTAKLIIRFDTFFRKGFKKIPDKFGCYCWIGKQGDGKTYSVVDYISEIRQPNQKVITNMVRYYENNKDFCIFNNNFYDIIEKFDNGTYDTDYIVFYDELFTLLEKGKLDKDITIFISQMRKRGVYLLTTVQEWLDINVTFRRYCRFYIECSMKNYFGCAFSTNVIHNGYLIHWDSTLNEYDAPIIKTTFKKCSKALADSYDTYEVIHDCSKQKKA